MALRTVLASFCVVALGVASPALAKRPVVVELYTSQGCSACPAADVLLKQMASDSAVLPLSFHVHYWDYLGWKDPFASVTNTNRQKAYVQLLDIDSVFTPQMIIDGSISTIGSDAKAVDAALSRAEDQMIEVPITITPDASGTSLNITIADHGSNGPVAPGAVAWEIHFNRGAVTAVGGGENTGQTLESTNNVTRIVPMALAPGRANQYILPLNFAEDGVAIILQNGPEGRVLGAASYIKSGSQQVSIAPVNVGGDVLVAQ